jgi:hypothetical protein
MYLLAAEDMAVVKMILVKSVASGSAVGSS